MKNNIIKTTVLLSLLFTIFSCNSFLDETPDNRTAVDSRDKIRKILVSAYLRVNYSMITELSSDNIVDYGSDNPNSDRFQEELAYWEDVTDKDNSDPRTLWDGCYRAIANANQALDAINELGGENEFKAEKGEALIARAYAHFVLVNVFARQYNSSTSGTDLGIVYMEKPEKTLDPKYKRESVKSIYEKINRDIEEALPLVDGSYYEVPQYHFTKSAAYAFAARFNLFYEKWSKAEMYAALALGQTPALRNWAALGDLPRKPAVTANAYIDDPSDLLSETSSSSIGLMFGPYYYGSRFNHTRYLADKQTLFAPMPFSKNGVSTQGFKYNPFVYSANKLDKTLFIKIPYLFEYTDPVAQTGYRKSVTIPFYTDETLLERAEAKILQEKYDEALADLNLWTANFYKVNTQVTKEQVDEFYSSMPYSTPAELTTKKTLNPSFKVSSGMQESMIHYLLQCRRVLTLHEGLRWFDLKRYGIPVERVVYDNSGKPNPANAVILPAGDPRRAIQLPQDVIGAGLEPNPR